MITPEDLKTLNDDDAKNAKALEEYVDELLRKSQYFGVELIYGNEGSKDLNYPARIWLHVLNKYVAAGWIVEPAPNVRLFLRPILDEKTGFPRIVIKASPPNASTK